MGGRIWCGGRKAVGFGTECCGGRGVSFAPTYPQCSGLVDTIAFRIKAPYPSGLVVVLC